MHVSGRLLSCTFLVMSQHRVVGRLEYPVPMYFCETGDSTGRILSTIPSLGLRPLDLHLSFPYYTQARFIVPPQSCHLATACVFLVMSQYRAVGRFEYLVLCIPGEGRAGTGFFPRAPLSLGPGLEACAMGLHLWRRPTKSTLNLPNFRAVV
jgi:hypothetical protein